ncbi:MAG: hypothetical protein J7K40_14625 [candidate division Zixibacteria bacterium]|nr:hypothetical protein [candidate division Zixibacteria bacterium]
MKNRVIEYLLEKNRQNEKEILSESWSLYPDLHPWEDKTSDDDENK